MVQVLHVIKVAAISDDGLGVTNALSFVQDSEATGAALWHAVSEGAGTIAHVAPAGDCALDVGPTVDTYQILRIEKLVFRKQLVLDRREATIPRPIVPQCCHSYLAIVVHDYDLHKKSLSNRITLLSILCRKQLRCQVIYVITY